MQKEWDLEFPKGMIDQKWIFAMKTCVIVYWGRQKPNVNSTGGRCRLPADDQDEEELQGHERYLPKYTVGSDQGKIRNFTLLQGPNGFKDEIGIEIYDISWIGQVPAK